MKQFLSKVSFSIGVLILLGLSAGSAYADGIVFVGADRLHPDGVGLRTILSLQSPGGSSTASGGVRWNGSGDQLFGDAIRGGTNNTVAVSDLGLSSTNGGVQIGFNINEPRGGPGSNPVTVSSMILTAYDQNGTAVFTASLLQSQTLTLIGNGQGTADYVFGLDSEAAARLAAAIAQNSNLRLGLEATILNAQGGPESFYLGLTRGSAEPVPEPATMVLFGTGILGIAAKVRSRRKAAKTKKE